MPKSRKSRMLDRAGRIDELANALDVITTDDRIELNQLTEGQIYREAQYVLDLFREGGTVQSEMLQDPDPAVRRDARQQVKALERFLYSYDPDTLQE